MKTLSKYVLVLLILTPFSVFPQAIKSIEIPFKTSKNIEGSAIVNSFFSVVENQHQVTLKLNNIKLDNTDCGRCSFFLNGEIQYKSTLKQKVLSIPFKTSEPLSANATFFLNVPFPFPENTKNQLIEISDWESTGAIVNVTISNFTGEKPINQNAEDFSLTRIEEINTNTNETENATDLDNIKSASEIENDLSLTFNKCNKQKTAFNEKKQQAIKTEDFLLANNIKQQATTHNKRCEQKIKELQTKLNIQKDIESKNNCSKEIEALNIEKENAVASEDYLRANSIKSKIQLLKETCGSTVAILDGPVQNTNAIKAVEDYLPVKASTEFNRPKIEEIEKTIETKPLSVLAQNPKTAIKNKTIVIERNHSGLNEILGTKNKIAPNTLNENNEMETKNIGLNKITGSKNNVTSNNNLDDLFPKSQENEKAKTDNSKLKRLSNADFDFSADLKKYKRSSLHTIMIRNPGAEQADVIEQTFLDRPLPEKFNSHKIDLDFISVQKKAKKQHKVISKFLSENDIAKHVVAKWFNRNDRGEFNMDLVAERGHYNATVFDVKIAKRTERGEAMLADAGEQLIANTFVIVNDYKYVNKEEVAKKTGFLSSLVSSAASFAGADDLVTIANATTIATSVVGKGYVVKVTSYLYRLKWDEAIANTFYENFWIDKNNYDVAKKEAFDNTDIFELELIGFETDFSGTQSTIFTDKTDAELIERATIKATDQTIARLQRKFSVFRTITPLISTEPLAAKIGLKEGLKKGDKFEVLEQFIEDDGTIGLKKIGIIKVDKNHIWDNRYKASEENPNTFSYTKFTGPKNKFYPGMLIRQIN